MKFTKEKILEYYKSEARKHKDQGTCTIQDIRTRKIEIKTILTYIEDGYKILEVGCGNGYVSKKIVETFDVEIDAIDFSLDMINLSKKQKINNPIGKVNFLHADILDFSKRELYDFVFTERCLQNLCTWDDQKKALANIVTAMKPNGFLVMLESFWTGLNNLNKARKELDLPEIHPPWHNLFFEEKKTIQYLHDLNCIFVDQNNLLSGYYFGSRVLLPAIYPKHKKVTSESILNDYFCFFPPYGDFCPMKILRFQNLSKGVS